MRKCSCCGIEKGLAEFHKHRDGREGRAAHCKACHYLKGRAWSQANQERDRAARQAWILAHPDKVAEAKQRWVERNPQKRLAALDKYIAANYEKSLAATARWAKANPDRNNARSTKHRARKLQATPAWANEFFIQEAYALAQLRSKMFGIKWHVDHIVPLQSALVCGLHTEANLQVIPGSHNQSKGNYRWPDMP